MLAGAVLLGALVNDGPKPAGSTSGGQLAAAKVTRRGSA